MLQVASIKFVSTDDEEIADVARAHGALVPFSASTPRYDRRYQDVMAHVLGGLRIKACNAMRSAACMPPRHLFRLRICSGLYGCSMTQA